MTSAGIVSIRGIPRPTLVLVGVLAFVNVALIGVPMWDFAPMDFEHYVGVGQSVLAGAPIYDVTGTRFNYSPLLAYGFIPLAALGFAGWALLHVAAAAAFPRPLGALALVSFPFWGDMLLGNVVTFLVLPALWAVRGKGWAIATTFVLAMLIPRPLMLPLVVWLLWKYPRWRLPFVGIAAVVGAATLATGMADEWLAVIGKASQDMGHYWNMSPSRFLGLAWLPIGVALAGVLLWHGYVGLACLAISPYLLPQYLLFALLDLRRHVLVAEAHADEERAGGAGLRQAEPHHLVRQAH